METIKTIYEKELIQPVKNKRILITGGTTGIGRATAHLLARENQVMIVGRHQPELDEAFDGFESFGGDQAAGRLIGIRGDLANPKDIDTLFGRVDDEFGQLNVLINNAGLGFNSIVDGEYTDWEYILRTNLLAYLACSRRAIDRMRNGGHIVNIGSMSADVREKDSSVYVATKSGIQGFSEALRKEINEMDIKVTLIEPGAVGTDMQPREGQVEKEGRLEMMKAEDIAVAIYYCLCIPLRCEVVEMKIKPHKQPI